MPEDPADRFPHAPDGPEAPDGPDAPPDGTEAAGPTGADDSPAAPSSGEDAGDTSDTSDAGDVGDAVGEVDESKDDGPVWGPPAAGVRDAEMVFGDAEALFKRDDAADDERDASGDDARDEWSPPSPLSMPRGTPLRIPVARARRPGILAAVLRAGWEELNYPRARVRAGMRRAANRMKERRLVASLLWGTLAGATFILYASGVGVTRGIFAWTVFAGVGIGLAVGGPAALVHAWPAAVAVPLVACAWAGWAFGSGALWLGLATCAGLLVLYFAAAEVAPLVAAAGVAWLVLPLTGSAEGEGGARLVVAGVAFAASAAIFIALRRRVTAPIVAAGWVVLSGVVAARVAWWTLGQAVPATWAVQTLPGPMGLTACVAGAAFGMALFSWPRRRETATQALFTV